MKISNADGVEFEQAVPAATLDGHAINKGQADETYAPIGGFVLLSPIVEIWNTEVELFPQWSGTYNLDLSAYVPENAKAALFYGNNAGSIVFWQSITVGSSFMFLSITDTSPVILPIIDQEIEYTSGTFADTFMTLVGYWI